MLRPMVLRGRRYFGLKMFGYELARKISTDKNVYQQLKGLVKFEDLPGQTKLKCHEFLIVNQTLGTQGHWFVIHRTVLG